MSKLDYCPNCGNKETVEEIDNGIYCPSCDQEIILKEGRTKPATGKSKLDQIIERMTGLEEKVQQNSDTIEEELF